MTYGEKLREEVLEKVLAKGDTSIEELAKEIGISRRTISNWTKEAGIGRVNSCSEALTKRGGYSKKDKLNMLKETFHMNELELGEYCRTKGILTSDLTKWEKELTQVEEKISVSERVELLQANRQLREELRRKEKALAEAAALLVLSKKVQAIWGENGEEK